MRIYNNSIGSVQQKQNIIQLDAVCTPVSVASFSYGNNERATVALFSASDVSAGQRGEAARLNPHSQTNKKQGLWAISWLWKWYFKSTSPYIQSIHILHTKPLNSRLSPSDRTSSEQSRSSRDEDPIVFALFSLCLLCYYCSYITSNPILTPSENCITQKTYMVLVWVICTTQTRLT